MRSSRANEYSRRTGSTGPLARLGLLAVFAAACWAMPAPAARADLASDVTASVRKVVESSTPKGASVGIQIVALGESPGQSRVLFARAADKPMIPASNQKLLTTAAAIDTLGSDFFFRTRLLVRRDEATGAVELAVVGDGDPSFGDSGLFKNIEGWDIRTVFVSWANALRQEGITRISAIYLDDSVFDDQFIHPNWPDNQRHRWYEAQLGGLNFNANCVDVYLTRGPGTLMSYRLDPPTQYVTVNNTCKRGTQDAVVLTRPEGTNNIILGGQTNASQQGPLFVTVHGPTNYFGAVFAETLQENGILCESSVVDRTIGKTWEAQQRARAAGAGATGDAASAAAQSAPPWQLLAVHQTPMATILARTNKDSMNLYAEALAKRMAHHVTGEPGSWSAAERVVKAYLARIGHESDHVRLDDGSGMSREDRASAAAFCDVLVAMHHSEAAEIFRASLSEAGVDGTLQKRFRGERSDLHRRVFGKTGYINKVCTFSGYLHGRDGKWYAFSILMNDNAQLAVAQQFQEQIIAALDRALEPSAATAGAAD